MYAGWNGSPGHEAHPLQSNFLHNIKEEVGNCKVDTFFGKNVWPNDKMKEAFTALNKTMYPTAVQVMKGCDALVEQALGPLEEDRMSMRDIAEQGTTLAGRFIWYDSNFSRDDTLLRSSSDCPTGDMCQQTNMKGVTTENRLSTDVCVQDDNLASMRTHATAIRTVGNDTGVLLQYDDSLASMRTHATAIRTTGSTASHCDNSLTSMKYFGEDSRSIGDGKDVMSSLHCDDSLASMRTHATAIRTTGDNTVAFPQHDDCLSFFRIDGTTSQTVGSDGNVVSISANATQSGNVSGGGDATCTQKSCSKHSDAVKGEYWLPWHIDSQFITLLTCDEFYDEHSSDRIEPRQNQDGVGLQVMNRAGALLSVAPQLDEDVMLVQIGGFAQIYSGGILTACRHAVLRREVTSGIARATYCNFWYAPWDLVCTIPSNSDLSRTVNSGWNALMDDSYVNISMMLSFNRFREFFTDISVGTERHIDHDLFSSLTSLLPPPSASGDEAKCRRLVLDILTDIRCPFSYVSICRLLKALQILQLGDFVTFRYHPVLLNPNVPEEGEELDSYLRREHGITAEEFHSNDYALMVAAKDIGATFHKDRRVVNTQIAFAAVEAASQKSMSSGHALFMALSKEYFENAADISRIETIRTVSAAIGIHLSEREIRKGIPSISTKHNSFRNLVTHVPCIVLRHNNPTGTGSLIRNPLSVKQYEIQLKGLIEYRPSSTNLFSPPGVVIPVNDGKLVRVYHANERHPASLCTQARRDHFDLDWTYLPGDFSRIDESSDPVKYATPRFVTHMDDSAIKSLTQLYTCILKPLVLCAHNKKITLMDTCGSWKTFYPDKMLPKGCRIIVQGLNAAELEANDLATEVLVQDLNASCSLPFPSCSIDFITNVASIEYITHPVDFLSEVHRLLRPGGVAVIAFSNRCFDDKAVTIWLRRIAVGAGLVDLVTNWLHYAAPWAHVSSVDVSPKLHRQNESSDPLYAIIAVKKSAE